MVAKAIPKRKARKAVPVFSEAESRLWWEYQSSRSIAARNALVEFYQGVLERIAWGLYRRLSGCELEDLIADGVPGLIHAIERFDLGRGFKFKTYAVPRIRGAMFDAIRDRDPAPRIARRHVGQLAKVETHYTCLQGRPATDAELKHALRLSDEHLARWKCDAVLCNVATASISQATVSGANRGAHQGWEAEPLERLLIDGHSPSPNARLDQGNWWEALLRVLGERGRAIVSLYFVHGWTMRMIGRHLLLAESRVSQIMGELLSHLRKCRSKADFDDIPTGRAGRDRLIDILPTVHRLRTVRRMQKMRQLQAA